MVARKGSLRYGAASLSAFGGKRDRFRLRCRAITRLDRLKQKQPSTQS
jgi:hypothetical protein